MGHSYDHRRTRLAARPVRLDKARIKGFVNNDLVPAVLKWLEQLDQDRKLGAQPPKSRGFIMIDAYGNPALPVQIFVGSMRAANDEYAVVHGKAVKQDTVLGDDVVLALFLNGNLTPAQLLQERNKPTGNSRKFLHYGLYSLMIHELTHVMEMAFMHEAPYAQEDGRPTDTAEYVNSPTEVRAFMQQIVDEVLIWAKRALTRSEAKGNNHRLIDNALKYSETWKRFGPHMNAASKKKIYSAVYDALVTAELLFET